MHRVLTILGICLVIGVSQAGALCRLDVVDTPCPQGQACDVDVYARNLPATAERGTFSLIRGGTGAGVSFVGFDSLQGICTVNKVNVGRWDFTCTLALCFDDTLPLMAVRVTKTSCASSTIFPYRWGADLTGCVGDGGVVTCP